VVVIEVSVVLMGERLAQQVIGKRMAFAAGRRFRLGHVPSAGVSRNPLKSQDQSHFGGIAATLRVSVFAGAKGARTG
jgi:hypothetical protein